MVLIRVAFPITRFKLFLVVAMIACTVLCFITPVGRMVFSLTIVSLNEWILVAAFTAASWPMITICVGLIRKLFERDNKIAKYVA